MIDSTVPAAIAAKIQRSHGVVSASPMPAGFSGAAVFRCQSETHGQLALRRWPSAVGQQRVSEVHRVQSFALKSGCQIVPQLLPIANDEQTFTIHQGSCWEIATWVPGTRLPSDASIDQIVTGAQAIAEFHQSVVELGQTTQQARCLTSRLERISQLDRLISQILAARLENSQIAASSLLRNALIRSQQLLQQNWSSVATEISRSLNRYACQSFVTQYVLRDVHRDHLLFTNAKPTGLVDFDAIRVDMPLTDLVRWAGSFIGGFDVDRDREEVWKAVLAGYGANPTFPVSDPIQQLQLARTLHSSGVWISLANWLNWIVVENRQFADQDEQIAKRIDNLIAMAVCAP